MTENILNVLSALTIIFLSAMVIYGVVYIIATAWFHAKYNALKQIDEDNESHSLERKTD